MSSDRFVAAHYRGTPQTQDLAEKLRLECVVDAGMVVVIRDTVLRHQGRRAFVFVVAVEAAYPEEAVPGWPGGAAKAAGERS